MVPHSPPTSSRVTHFNKQERFPQYVVIGPKSVNCCASPVILGLKSSLLLSPEKLWANYTSDYTAHSLNWVQACFSNRVTAWKKAGASQLWRQKSSVCRPSNGGISFPQTDWPVCFCSLLPLEHGGVQAPQFISCQKPPAKRPVSASCNIMGELNRANLDSPYGSAEEDCQCYSGKWPRGVGKNIHQVLIP